MNLDEAKILFEAGVLAGADIHHPPMSNDDWMVTFRLKQVVRDVDPSLVTFNGAKLRTFKDLRRAVSLCETVGIKTVTVQA